jgi:ParB/RepB/Spo0J family partition protein
MVVKKRTEDQGTNVKDSESAGRFTTRVAKLRGEGPMATSEEPEVALEVISVNIKDIEIPSNYVRKTVGDVTPLVESIKIYGIQQPLKIVKLKGTKKYRLVFGRRRLRAAEIAGLHAVPCIVELATREDRLQMLSLAENMHRNDLTPLEEGDSYQQMLSKNTSLEELSKSLYIPADAIRQAIEFLTLPTPVQKDIMNCPERFSSAVLKILLQTFNTSKVNGKKLLTAVVSGEVKNPTDALIFISKLQ